MRLLIAEDDPDDRLLIRRAFAATGFDLDLRIVGDGEELMEYLQRRGPYVVEVAPRPGLIVLDLNMPRKNGREALVAIKTDPDLQTIPVHAVHYCTLNVRIFRDPVTAVSRTLQ